uniref:Uncharacterized protein n=1 Tax=Myotis myotis TaxID=51298 RepID=A0A7J7U5M5_MYOMY|nr:hypothetical protein mMyoMyo1_008900 [Myotis myotis]
MNAARPHSVCRVPSPRRRPPAVLLPWVCPLRCSCRTQVTLESWWGQGSDWGQETQAVKTGRTKGKEFFSFSFFLFFFFRETDRERERETATCCPTYFVRSLVILVCGLRSNPQPWCTGMMLKPRSPFGCRALPGA